MAKPKQDNQPQTKKTVVPQTDFPIFNVDYSTKIARAIWESFAGKGAAPHDIAIALDMSPTSGTWRNLCGSSIAYGLTDGGYAASEILLTPLGRRLVAPEVEGDDRAALREAVMMPRLLGDFFRRYDKSKLPKDDIGRNVLAGMGLPKDRAEKAFSVLVENGEKSGIIRETKTGPFVALDGPTHQTARQAAPVEEDEELADFEHEETPDKTPPAPPPSTATKPNKLFVAHGKNLKALASVKKILDEFKIPYAVAVDEAHAGRPISKKVAQLMRDCSAGVFIFTKDERFIVPKSDGEEDKEIWRPSENVVYELGAAGILWETKIIIMRENGVQFPSDFNDLGYITFEDGNIETQTLNFLKELVALGLVKIG